MKTISSASSRKCGPAAGPLGDPGCCRHDVYVSAIVFGDACEEILVLARAGLVDLYVSPHILSELRSTTTAMKPAGSKLLDWINGWKV